MNVCQPEFKIFSTWLSAQASWFISYYSQRNVGDKEFSARIVESVQHLHILECAMHEYKNVLEVCGEWYDPKLGTIILNTVSPVGQETTQIKHIVLYFFFWNTSPETNSTNKTRSVFWAS